MKSLNFKAFALLDCYMFISDLQLFMALISLSTTWYTAEQGETNKHARLWYLICTQPSVYFKLHVLIVHVRIT